MIDAPLIRIFLALLACGVQLPLMGATISFAVASERKTPKRGGMATAFLALLITELSLIVALGLL